MRLLDHVAQCAAPFTVLRESGEIVRLAGPSDYAQKVARCPLRYVLSDEVLRACIDLAYSEGAGLAACLDLIHFPAEEMWVEWNAAAFREQLDHMRPSFPSAVREDCRLHGVLVSSDAIGRSGQVRTFWLTASEPAQPMMAATETFIDLSGDLPVAPPETLLDGGSVAVRDSLNSQIDSLLRCASFRLDDSWQRYYAAGARTADARAEVLERSLGTVAFITPVLVALFLLIGLRSEIIQAPISRDRVNAKRLRLGKRPLLSHIEVSCPVLALEARRAISEMPAALRTAPRLHHVRGHIVRREDAVYWRRAHWRGHLRLGSVQSRTVTLRLPAAAAHSARRT